MDDAQPHPHPSDERPLADDAIAASARKGGGNIAFIVGAIVTACAVVALAMTSFDEQVYYYTVAEARTNHAEIGTREFRIKGNVVAGSHHLRDGVLNDHVFVLRADGADMVIHYTGPIPDTFADDAEVIALGRFTDPERFDATEVVAKCPSRYEEGAPTAASSRASL